MLQARGLTKRYGGLLALDKVSFELRPGEIVGYLGPNGSGKSTTVNLVVGLLEPSAGAISLNGISLSIVWVVLLIMARRELRRGQEAVIPA